MAKGKSEESSKGMSGGAKAAVGAAAAAAAVAAAGAYWFYGAADAAKHRKSARSWMLKARADVMEAVEAAMQKVGEIDKETYGRIVDGVLKRYSSLAGASAAEMAQMSKDMKEAWKQMQRAGGALAKRAKAAPAAARKRAAKKR